MSDEAAKRRAAAEISFGGARNPIISVGPRAVHHYWTLLAPHFRGLLLTPQRRTDDKGLSWTWLEAAGAKPPTAPELGEIRERLRAARVALEDDPAVAAAEAKIAEAMEKVVEKLVAKSDAQLSAFVCRTETGLMIHSWGATTAAVPFYPDSVDCSVGGTLLVGDKDASNLEVVLENRKGFVVAKTHSDSTGAFEFQKVHAGSYRVRAVGDRVDFPVNGLEVEVGRTSVTDIKLRSTALNVSVERMRQEENAPRIRIRGSLSSSSTAAHPEERPRSRRWRKGAGVTMGVVGLALAGWWFWPASRVPAKTPPATGTFVVATKAPAPAGTDVPRASGSYPDSGVQPGAGGVADPSPGAKSPTKRAAAVVASKVQMADVDAMDESEDPTAADEPLRPEFAKTEARTATGSPRGSAPKAVAPAAAAKANTREAGNAETIPDEEMTLDPVTPDPPAAEPKTRKPLPKRSPRRTRDEAETGSDAMPPVPAEGRTESGSIVDTGVAQKPLDAETARKSKLAKAVVPPPREPAPTVAIDANTTEEPRDEDPATNGTNAARKDRIKKRAAGGAAGGAGSMDRASGTDELSPAEKPGRAERAEEESPANKVSPAGKQARSTNQRENQTTKPESPPEAEEAASATPENGRVAATRSVPTASHRSPARMELALTSGGRMRVSAWASAIVRDEIVPTKPVLAGEDDALEMLRERMILQRRDRIPQTISAPRTRQGIAVVLPRGKAGGMRWRNVQNADDIEAVVTEEQAEVSWRSGGRSSPAELILESREGGVTACVRISAEGVGELETTSERQAHGWIGVECAPADLAGLTPEEQRMRFGWRLAGQSSVTADWIREISWRNATGRRVEFPLELGSTDGPRTLVFQDHVTGWAMSCKIEPR